MLRLLLFTLLLVASVWLGLHIAADPGYVLLAYSHWRIELPLWLAAIILLLGFVVLYSLMRLIINTFQLGPRFKSWRDRRRSQAAEKATRSGILALIKGEWVDAEKALLKGSTDTSAGVINFLAAAAAAQKQTHHTDKTSDSTLQRRDNYLQRALQLDKSAELVVSLTQAHCQLEQQQLEQALASLQHCRQLAPKNPWVLDLLQKVYRRLNDWEQWLALLPSLKRYKVLPSKQQTQLALLAYQDCLRHEAKQNDYQLLYQAWSLVPKSLKQSPSLVAVYCQALKQLKQTTEAEKLLRRTLNKTWDETLLALYADLDQELTTQQLKVAEQWLKTRADDPALFETLGRLCMAQKLWGQAKSYFEQGLAIDKRPSLLHALAVLHEQLNEPDRALEYYREFAG